MGVRGLKNTPFAAQIATEDAVKTAYELGLRKVDIFIKGPGAEEILQYEQCKMQD